MCEGAPTIPTKPTLTNAHLTIRPHRTAIHCARNTQMREEKDVMASKIQGWVRRSFEWPPYDPGKFAVESQGSGSGSDSGSGSESESEGEAKDGRSEDGSGSVMSGVSG